MFQTQISVLTDGQTNGLIAIDQIIMVLKFNWKEVCGCPMEVDFITGECGNVEHS